MANRGKITITVTGSTNQETIKIATVGAVGSVNVNDINNSETYSSRSSAATSVAYWTAILTRAISQL